MSVVDAVIGEALSVTDDPLSVEGVCPVATGSEAGVGVASIGGDSTGGVSATGDGSAIGGGEVSVGGDSAGGGVAAGDGSATDGGEVSVGGVTAGGLSVVCCPLSGGAEGVTETGAGVPGAFTIPWLERI